MGAQAIPRSLVWATDYDVLPVDHVVERRDGYLVVRSPGNPAHYWGNLLLFDDAPQHRDGERWERLFELEFGENPLVEHVTLAWDRVDGALGSAREEFVARGYELDEVVGLVADSGALRVHPRANREVVIRDLDPQPGADRDLWDQAIELQVASRDDFLDERTYREFLGRRLEDLRVMFRAGRGAWFVAMYPGRRRGRRRLRGRRHRRAGPLSGRRYRGRTTVARGSARASSSRPPAAPPGTAPGAS